MANTSLILNKTHLTSRLPLKATVESTKVALILPVYNVGRYLCECLDLIRAQTYENFKVFAVNDGSTDDSGAILDKYATNDKRFVVFHKRNGGVSSARNVALEAIEKDGTFDGICFADSDDVITPNFMECYVRAILDHDADTVVCGYVRFNKKGFLPTVSCAHGNKVLDRDGMFRHYFRIEEWGNVESSTFSGFLANRYFSAKCLKGLRFDESLSRTEDADFLFRALHRVEKGVVLAKDLYHYRMRSSSLSNLSLPDVDIFKFFLRMLPTSGDLSESCRLELERVVLETWWRSVRKTVRNGTFDINRSALTLALQSIHDHNFLRPIPLGFRLKFELFSLGKPWLFLVVALRGGKKKLNAYQRRLIDAFD